MSLQIGEGKYREEQEKIYFDNMQNRHACNWYKDLYKSFGSILHWMYVYDGLHIVEHILVGDGKVYYPTEKNLIATYEFDDDKQMPIFNFIDNYNNLNDIQDIYLRLMEKKV